MASLEQELEETRERAAQFEEEVEEESQGQDMQLLDSQVCMCIQMCWQTRVFGYIQCVCT